MTIRLLAALFIVVTAPQTLCAQEAPLQSYDVELIIFRVNRPSSSPENWSLSGVLPKPAAPTEDETTTSTGAAPIPAPPAPAAAPPPPAETSFPALNASQMRMNGVAESLRRGKTYQPLAHFGWTQPGFPLGASPKFSIRSYLPGFLPEGISLDGEVSLSRGPRLLHLMLDLTYQAPEGQRYFLRETRRMRSTERHYLDHPYFGVIALITPRG
jgi:hypothetical protein